MKKVSRRILLHSRGSGESYPHAIILGTTLGDGHQDRLVVGGTCHGADAVVASGQTARDGRGEGALAVAGVVDTLEEGELGRVRGRAGVLRVAHVLDGDVGVPDDGAARAELLGGRVVGAVGVGEGTQVHVGDLDGDVEVLIGRGLLAGDGAGDDSRDHLGLRGHVTHGDTVTRALLLLDAVGQCLAGTEVDEVAIVRLRFGLAVGSTFGSVLCRAGLDGVLAEGCSTVATIVCRSRVSFAAAERGAQ